MWLSILSWRNRKKIAMEGIDYVWGTDYSDKNINNIPPGTLYIMRDYTENLSENEVEIWIWRILNVILKGFD